MRRPTERERRYLLGYLRGVLVLLVALASLLFFAWVFLSSDAVL